MTHGREDDLRDDIKEELENVRECKLCLLNSQQSLIEGYERLIPLLLDLANIKDS